MFGCFEVTIGWYGHERVDYITYDTSGIWRCYEIKASKSDFYSPAKHTFLGHYNYFVLTKELYEQVKQDVPQDIGVYYATEEHHAAYCIKRPKKRNLGIDEKVLKDSLIRSLYRDAVKVMDSEEAPLIDRLKSVCRRAQADADRYEKMYSKLLWKGIEKYGSDWYKD